MVRTIGALRTKELQLAKSNSGEREHNEIQNPIWKAQFGIDLLTGEESKLGSVTRVSSPRPRQGLQFWSSMNCLTGTQGPRNDDRVIPAIPLEC